MRVEVGIGVSVRVTVGVVVGVEAEVGVMKGPDVLRPKAGSPFPQHGE